jgi:hypothetical protein
MVFNPRREPTASSVSASALWIRLTHSGSIIKTIAPTDVNLDREISSVRGFGKELVQNKQEALQVWKEKIKANGKSDFEAEILSTDLFLELARQLSTHQDRADEFQKSIIRIAKQATEVMGSKEALKAELKRIVEVFDTAEKQVAMRQAHPMFENPNKKVYSVIGTNWDHGQILKFIDLFKLT